MAAHWQLKLHQPLQSLPSQAEESVAEGATVVHEGGRASKLAMQLVAAVSTAHPKGYYRTNL